MSSPRCSSFWFVRQSGVGLLASAAPSVSQSHLQCQSCGSQGTVSPDPSIRVWPHPERTDGWTARSAGALQPQPAARAAAADQSSSQKISQLRQVRLKKKLLCWFIHRTLSGSLNHPHSPLSFVASVVAVTCVWR